MTPREIAERHVSVDESIGEGGMRVFLFGEEVAHFQGESYDASAYALADELRSKLAAACEEAAAEARRAEREACERACEATHAEFVEFRANVLRGGREPDEARGYAEGREVATMACVNAIRARKEAE